jgi:poly-gamma-glutamate capsule biosynthesis protein CapA/YwtB (metallophosphatase superfamily)
MVYQADDRSELSMVELAQGGHLPSLNAWLNQRLATHRLHAKLSYVRPGYIRIAIALRPSPKVAAKSPAFQKRLTRFICHQLWILNSDVLDGAYVVASYIGKPSILWKQSVRITSPARKAVIAAAAQNSDQSNVTRSPQHLNKALRHATQKRKQFQLLRSMMISGSSAAAFMMGCWLGYADAPAEQTSASASNGIVQVSNSNQGSGTVKAALETIAVIPHKTQSADPTVNLMFGGDVTLTNSYTDKVGKNYQWAFSQLDEFRQADVSMVNLEAPFTTATQPLPGKKFNFKSPIEDVQVLQNGGIDIVNLANNHSMDYQGAGLLETTQTLQKAGIQSIGAGENSKAARRPVIMNVKGKKVAYLGYYDADLHAATADGAGTNPRHNDRVAADIKALRKQVDWIVVNYHWGEELAKYPGDWQMDLARFTIDQGADLVVGHHAHVLQGAEIYKGRPIVYSLGNFIFGGNSISDYDTAALKVSLKDQQMRVEFLPVQVRGYQARVVNGQAGQQILGQITAVSDIFQQPMTSTMTLNTATNQVVPIEAAKPTAADTVPTIAPAEPMVPEKNDSPELKPETKTDTSPETKTNVKPEAEKTPDPENPWSQDSFISGPNKGEKLLTPHSALPQELNTDGKQIVKTASLKEVPIDGVQSESIADRESMDTPKSIVQNSDVAKDTVISAPEPVAAVSPDVTSTSLEPIKKHDAGIKTPAVVASSTPALNSSTNAIATQSDNTQLNDIQVATNPEKNTSPVK